MPEESGFLLVIDEFDIHSWSAYVPGAKTLWKTQWILPGPDLEGL